MNILQQADPEVWQAIDGERRRQQQGLEMIASENYTSPAVLAAQGSVLTNKYAEGYPGRRYYGGCEFVDVVEHLAIDRACKLFGAEHANVQPHSGAQANMAVYFACLEPGDTILAMDLAHGGHLTHGMQLNFSGKLYKVVSYGVRQDTERIDFDQVAALAREHKPKLIVAGGQRLSARDRLQRASPRSAGNQRAVHGGHGPHRRPGGRRAASRPGAGRRLRHLDHAQDAARAARRLHPVQEGLDPEGQPGGLSRHPGRAADARHRRQGGLLSAKPCKPEFKTYAAQIVANARALADELERHGFRLVSGGTDNHLMLVDVASRGVTGKNAEKALDAAGITVNKNMIPFDTRQPLDPSGIRIGTPALTTRGMREPEMRTIAQWIDEVLKYPADTAVHERVRSRVHELCRQFPAPANAL